MKTYRFVLCGHCLFEGTQDTLEAVERMANMIDHLIAMDKAGVEFVGQDEDSRLYFVTDDPKLAEKFGMEEDQDFSNN